MKNNPGSHLRDYLQLSKLYIMLPVCLTGFTGYFIYNPGFSIKLLLICVAILLLAVSASTLNQIQEVSLDSRMKRTNDRPIPAGKISLKHATIFFLICFLAGSVMLYRYANIAALLTGLFTILWYNGVYTYIKRISAFAVVPGALTGVLPLLTGWLAAGGEMWAKPIIFLEFLFFTGQIPHFWLLILKYGEEYHDAGIPTLTDIFTRDQINRLTFTWVITSVIAALFLCFFKIIKTGVGSGILLSASVYLLWKFSSLIKKRSEDPTPKKFSILLDTYFLLVLLLLISERLLL
jgi:heme o synthase